jgi:hypothetical protein
MNNEYLELLSKAKNAFSNNSSAKSKILLVISVLLTKIGVPPSKAEKLAPVFLFIITIQIGFLFLFLVFIIFFQPNNKSDYIKPNEYYKEINQELANFITSTSNKYQIPSRILLGIAGSQTNFGRYSPYDQIDRNPSSNLDTISDKNLSTFDGSEPSIFPILNPNIGSQIASDGEGQGIYLIKYGPAIRAGINPQDVRESTVYLAGLMRSKANEFKKQGFIEPKANENDITKIDDFWSKVVATLPLVDPISNRCSDVSNKLSPDVLISLILNCELDNIDKINFINYDSKKQLYYIDNSIKNSDILIEETLRVAWYWAKKQKPEIANWKDVKNIPCNNNKNLAGILPLTKANASKIGITNRCDNLNVITNFTKHLVNSHKIENVPAIPSKNYYKETIIGWNLIPWALGNKNNYNEFIEFGVETDFIPSSLCDKLTTDYLYALSLNQELVDNINNNELNSDKLYKIFINSDPNNSRNFLDCYNNGNIVSDNIWFSYLIDLSSTLSITLYEDKIINENLFSIFSLLQNDIANELQFLQAIGGVHSLIPRFSSRYLEYNVPDSLYNNFLSSDLSLWSRFLSYITRLGGMTANDPRAGNFFLGTSYSIAIERVKFITYPVFLRRQDAGIISVRNCGSSNEIIMTPTYSFRWAKFCQDTISSGNKAIVISSWRDPKKQEKLRKGAVEGYVAKGTSNHQRGIAVDIAMGQILGSDGLFRYIGSNDLSFKYIHSIKGCLDIKNKIYSPLSSELTPEEYVKNITSDSAPCAKNTIPIKRAQLFGIIPLCKGAGEVWSNPDVILCDPETRFKGSNQFREPWHLEPGEIFLQLQLASNCNISYIDVGNKQNVAESIKKLWLCELEAAGFNSLSPIEGPNYPALDYFENLAQQISSEAVVVSYCESGLNYNSGLTGKYQGLFQMGEPEIIKYGDSTDRIDPINNIRAAVRYFIASYKNNHGKGWAGWGPWAVVNTNYSNTNPNVLVPIIGRFKSTNPERLGQYASDLPRWAIDPISSWGKGPINSCLEIYKGNNWD